MRLRRKRYHEGGGIPPHEHLPDGSHPILGYDDDTSEDSNILGSLITDTTQEPDALRVDMPGLQTGINIIEDPNLKPQTFTEELAAQSKRLERIKELQLLEYFHYQEY